MSGTRERARLTYLPVSFQPRRVKARRQLLSGRRDGFGDGALRCQCKWRWQGHLVGHAEPGSSRRAWPRVAIGAPTLRSSRISVAHPRRASRIRVREVPQGWRHAHRWKHCNARDGGRWRNAHGLRLARSPGSGDRGGAPGGGILGRPPHAGISVRISQCAVQRCTVPVGASPTRQGSFQPVAIGTAVEATKQPKLPMEKGPKGLSERIGRNVQ